MRTARSGTFPSLDFCLCLGGNLCEEDVVVRDSLGRNWSGSSGEVNESVLVSAHNETVCDSVSCSVSGFEVDVVSGRCSTSIALEREQRKKAKASMDAIY